MAVHSVAVDQGRHGALEGGRLGRDHKRGHRPEPGWRCRHDRHPARLALRPLILVQPDAAGVITGGAVAKRVLDVAGEVAPLHVDPIGVGASVLDHLEAFVGPRVIPVNGASASTETDFSGQLRFVNKRAEVWWKMREALDPTRPVKVALPRDQRLFADLAAPRYRVTARGIQVEPKEEIKRRLGRSPDRGDAVVLAAVRTPIFIDHNRGGRRFTVRRSLQGFRREDR